ncbi:MAG: hypothetical protein ACO1NN_13420 [Sphingopyxis sp.]
MAKGFDAYETYEEAKLFSSYCIRKLAGGETLDTIEIDAALKLNKELRRLYDQFGRNGRGAFELIYQPLGGWHDYFRRHENELSYLKMYDEVQAEVEGAKI